MTPAELLADQQRVVKLQGINQPVQERSAYYLALEKASFRRNTPYAEVLNLQTRFCMQLKKPLDVSSG